MTYKLTYKIRTIALMVLSILLLSTAPTHAAFLVKKQSMEKPLISKNTTRVAVLYEKLLAFKKQKGSFISKARHLVAQRSSLARDYGEKKGNLFSILSLVCGCLSYGAIFGGLFAFIISLTSSAIVAASIGGGVLALAAIILGVVALRQHQTRGMAIAGIILGSIFLTLYGFVWLILLSYA